MWGKSQRDSPILDLFAPPREYGGMISYLPIINTKSTPSAMDIWSAI